MKAWERIADRKILHIGSVLVTRGGLQVGFKIPRGQGIKGNFS